MEARLRFVILPLCALLFVSACRPTDASGSCAAFDVKSAEARSRIEDEFRRLNAFEESLVDDGDGSSLFASAIKHNNANKNRYANILAKEETRVRLQAYRALALDSDYINANFLFTEDRSAKPYIACQAPLPSTMSSFWLMIWVPELSSINCKSYVELIHAQENNSPLVVMLTRLHENGRVKASAYWPDRVGSTADYGPFEVKLVASKPIDAHIEERALDFTYDGVTRRIIQLHYTEWPDFGTPDSTRAIRQLAALANLHRTQGMQSGLRGPMAVHCSAGVGRAGTFIAIHSALDRLKSGNEPIYIPGIVATLRRSRIGMVQTLAQYRFIYETVRDACLTPRANRVDYAHSEL